MNVQSAIEVFHNSLIPFQYYSLQADGSLYPIDYQDVNGDTVTFVIDGVSISLEYNSVVYCKDKIIHRFTNQDMEILLHDYYEEIIDKLLVEIRPVSTMFSVIQSL